MDNYGELYYNNKLLRSIPIYIQVGDLIRMENITFRVNSRILPILEYVGIGTLRFECDLAYPELHYAINSINKSHKIDLLSMFKDYELLELCQLAKIHQKGGWLILKNEKLITYFNKLKTLINISHDNTDDLIRSLSFIYYNQLK